MTVKLDKVKKCVIDTSVVVKWFSEEPKTSEAEMVLNQAHEGAMELYAPDILIYELANALWKGKHLPLPIISDALERIYNSPIQLLAPDKLLSFSSAQFMTNYDLTFYDASYVGLSHVLKMPLLTANPKDHKKVKEIEQIQL
jgi:predicted nucleic acid-binding protein